MAKKLLILLAVVAALFGLGFLLPAEQLVGRSVAVNAPPEAIYTHLESLQAWTWSPWARLRYDGPEAGVGARMVWQDETLGEGRFWLTKADPTRGVAYEMSLNREPYTATGAVQLVPSESSTLVVWTWKGRYSVPLGRLVGLVAGEKLGARFEQGLLALKKVAEASAPVRPPSPVIGGTAAPAQAPTEPAAEAPAEPEPERAPAPTTPETLATPTQQ